MFLYCHRCGPHDICILVYTSHLTLTIAFATTIDNYFFNKIWTFCVLLLPDFPIIFVVQVKKLSNNGRIVAVPSGLFGWRRTMSKVSTRNRIRVPTDCNHGSGIFFNYFINFGNYRIQFEQSTKTINIQLFVTFQRTTLTSSHFSLFIAIILAVSHSNSYIFFSFTFRLVE